MENNQPIIVKRVKKIAGGHHGGAWKIAFADFATAMMAFFMLLWLMSSATPEQKKLISGYFQDPVGFSESASPYVIDLGGTPTPAPDKTLNPEVKDQLEAGPEQDVGKEAEVNTRALIYELLDFVDDVVDELGCRAATNYIPVMMENGTGADRQLKVYEETKNFTSVVDYIGGQFLHGI